MSSHRDLSLLLTLRQQMEAFPGAHSTRNSIPGQGWGRDQHLPAGALAKAPREERLRSQALLTSLGWGLEPPGNKAVPPLALEQHRWSSKGCWQPLGAPPRSQIPEGVSPGTAEPSVSPALHTPGCAHSSDPSLPSLATGTKGISWNF